MDCPGASLTQEPAEPNTMRTPPPRDPQEQIFGRGMGVSVIWIGALMGIVSLLVGLWASNFNHAFAWQTMIFTTLTMAQMGNALATRSESQTLWEVGILTNKALLGSVILTFALQMAVVYLPFLQKIFKTQALSLLDWESAWCRLIVDCNDADKLMRKKATGNIRCKDSSSLSKQAAAKTARIKHHNQA